MHVQITKTKRKLFNTKLKITNGLLLILGVLGFPIIPQHDTLN